MTDAGITPAEMRRLIFSEGEVEKLEEIKEDRSEDENAGYDDERYCLMNRIENEMTV